jgi:AcrR family transcriptional regulator
MPRPRTISNEEILRIAREVFLERGPTATTAEIARRAGISEGTIFKRFPTKNALFSAAMGAAGLEHLRDWTDQMARLVGKGSVRDNLVTLMVSLIELFRQLLPRIMLVWSSRDVAAERIKTLHGEDSPPRRGLASMARYLEREMDKGRLRRGDPELFARIFLGSAWNLAFTETLSPNAAKEEPRSFAQRLVDTLWTGIAPGDGDR